MNESQDSNDSSTSNPNDIRQQEAEHQGAAVKAALGANIGVAIAKLAAAFFTGSSAMLSESVHSIADCSNEIVLMAGGRFSKHKTDGDHPFGLYRAKYLASFVVATLLFFVGGFFSTSEAVKKLFAIAEDPALRDVNQMELLVAFIVVFISACLEGYGLHQSIKEANGAHGCGPYGCVPFLEAYQVGGACVRHYGRHACFDRLGIRRGWHRSCDSV